MVLFDALFVKSSGGLNILSIIVKELTLEQKKNNFLVLDKKANIKSEYLRNFYKIKRVRSSLYWKLYFYNINKWEKIFSLGNFPSINFNKSEIYVYNMQYFLFDISMLKGKLKAIWSLKRKMIQFFFKIQNPNIIFQTDFMKNISKNSSIRFKKSFVFPLYKEFSKIENFKTQKDFLYITSNQSYKNNIELTEAWRSSSTNRILYLTIENTSLKSNKNIIYLGQMSHDNIQEFVIRNKPVIIQASDVESFGITCIEASMWGLPLLALKRDYLNSVISDYSYFNDFNDLIKILNEIDNHKFNIPKIKAKNDPEGLINLIWS